MVSNCHLLIWETQRKNPQFFITQSIGICLFYLVNYLAFDMHSEKQVIVFHILEEKNSSLHFSSVKPGCYFAFVLLIPDLESDLTFVLINFSLLFSITKTRLSTEA